jgi:hypothetical protein
MIYHSPARRERVRLAAYAKGNPQPIVLSITELFGMYPRCMQEMSNVVVSAAEAENLGFVG